MRKKTVEDILDRYRGKTHVFLLIVDRDCDQDRRAKLDALEAHARERLEGRRAVFLAAEALQEVEVWVLAGLTTLPKGWRWKEIRAECHPKEVYYDAVAKDRGLIGAVAQGRRVLATEAAANYKRIKRLCPEDVGRLEDRLGEALKYTP